MQEEYGCKPDGRKRGSGKRAYRNGWRPFGTPWAWGKRFPQDGAPCKATNRRKATAREINKYIKAIDGKDKKERRQIFIDMFIAEKAPKTAKPAKKSFDDNLKDLLKEKRAEEKAKKQ